MKPATLSLAALLLGLALHRPAMADTPTETRLAKAEKNYAACLNSDNEGVVAGAIAGVVRLKIAAPDRPMEELIEKLGDLMVNGPTAAIRYRAYLAGAAVENPDLLPSSAAETETDVLFSLIAVRLQSVYLGYAIQ